MSYILSALKKAEQERQGGGVPDVLTPQAAEEASPLSPGRVSKPYWIGVVAALLLLGLWLAGALWFDDGAIDPGAGDNPVAQRGAVANGAAGGSRDQQSVVPSQPGDADAEPVRAALLAPKPYDGFTGDEDDFATAPAADRVPGRADPQASGQWAFTDEVLDIAELPPSLRKRLPRLELTGHLYSLAHPTARKVILNGVALKEKQYLNDDLLINEITPDGVILDFRGRLFRLGADQMFR